MAQPVVLVKSQQPNWIKTDFTSQNAIRWWALPQWLNFYRQRKNLYWKGQRESKITLALECRLPRCGQISDTESQATAAYFTAPKMSPRKEGKDSCNHLAALHGTPTVHQDLC